MKRFVSTLLVGLLFIGNPALASEPYFHPPLSTSEEGTSLFQITEQSGSFNYSSLEAHTLGLGGGYPVSSRLCSDGSATGPCDPLTNKAHNEGSMILGPCAISDPEFCLSDIEFTLANGEQSKGEFLRYVNGPTSSAIARYNLPAGQTISLWNIPGATNSAGTTTYAVLWAVTMTFNNSKKMFEARRTFAQVSPYKLDFNDRYATTVTREVPRDNGTFGVTSFGWSDEKPCVWVDQGQCGLLANFPEGVRVSITARIPKETVGWFHGRFKAPDIRITQQLDWKELTVSAMPVDVQRFMLKLREAELNQQQKQSVTKIKGGTGRDWFLGNSLKGSFADSPDSFEYLSLFRELSKDTSAGSSSLWSFSSSWGTARNSWGNSCLDDQSKVHGIVATNATVYSGTQPKYKGGFFEYSVAGMHYTQDGQEAEGTYDLIINSDTARCLYKFSKAPISATISVGGKEASKVATTTLSERNGWLKLAAYGFTFSEKTIKVKLTQKKSTIYCVNTKNEKTIKKVTGFSPSCPTGYRKK